MTLDLLAPALRALSRPGAKDIVIGAAVIKEWPAEFVAALLKESIVTAGPVAQNTICPGCPRNCMMGVACLDEAGVAGPSALVVCDKPEDYGIINIGSASLQQWRCTRPGLINFLARQFGVGAKTAGSALGFIPFGISKRLKRTVALEFADTPMLMIGDAGHDLADLLIWNGGRIALDWELLQAIGDRLGAASSGRQYQRSTINRENRKHRTNVRNRDLQVAMDRVRAAHPKWNKERCAKEVGKNGKVSWQRIMRVTLVRNRFGGSY